MTKLVIELKDDDVTQVKSMLSHMERHVWFTLPEDFIDGDIIVRDSTDNGGGEVGSFTSPEDAELTVFMYELLSGATIRKR